MKFTRNNDDVSAKVLAGHRAVAAADHELAAPPQTGGLSREWWSGVIGQARFGLGEDPRFPDARTSATQLRTSTLNFPKRTGSVSGFAVTYIPLSPAITSSFSITHCLFHPTCRLA